MEKTETKHFRSLSSQKILAQRPGTWGDYKLLDVLGYFHEKGDRRREAAVRELILRSPENDEMVDYGDLYFYQVDYARWIRDYPAALRWAYAALAYGEQRQPGMNRDNLVRDIAEINLQAGALDVSLSLYSRCLEAQPADIWIYNSLALMLLEAGMFGLALKIIDRALELVATDDPERLQEQLSGLRDEAAEGQAGKKSRPAEMTPAVLSKLRSAMWPAVQPATTPPVDSDIYLPPIDSLISLEGAGLETTYQEIIAQGPILAPDLIRLAFDENLRGTPAPGHALALLRDLSAGPMATELAELSFWLDRAQSDWQRELLTMRAGKVGGYYTDELEVVAADTSNDSFVRVSMVGALAERAQKCPEQRERIVRGMRVLLTRPEAYEAAEERFIGFLIGDMEDLEAKELYPEIEAAFAEDRVDPTIIS
jgi:tetratricopeptide (TPR) repeat protein